MIIELGSQSPKVVEFWKDFESRQESARIDRRKKYFEYLPWAQKVVESEICQVIISAALADYRDSQLAGNLFHVDTQKDYGILTGTVELSDRQAQLMAKFYKDELHVIGITLDSADGDREIIGISPYSEFEYQPANRTLPVPVSHRLASDTSCNWESEIEGFYENPDLRTYVEATLVDLADSI